MSRMIVGETQEDLALSIKEFFSIDDYTVELENTGPRVLECLRRSVYAVILLDIHLPGLDAISIIRSYRTGGGSAPLILMSDQHCSDELQCGLDAGADAYLVKPFELCDLAAQLRA